MLCNGCGGLTVRTARIMGTARSLASRATAGSAALPVVDIAPFVNGALADDQRRSAEALHAACSEVGFFYVTGHGVPDELLTGIRAAAAAFFALPEAEKERIAIARHNLGRGWQRLGQNVTQGQPDRHEGLDMMRELADGHPAREAFVGTPHAQLTEGRNRYPDPGFEALVGAYVGQMAGLGRAICSALELGLGRPLGDLTGRVGDPFWVMRMIGYPGQPEGSDGMGCGEHTDYGILTLLNQDECPGALQVKTKAGDWVAADPLPGALVVNIGDMLAHWSKGVYRSTPHRVQHTGTAFRISVPFFFEPDFTAAFNGVRYGDHLLAKVQGNFAGLD